MEHVTHNIEHKKRRIQDEAIPMLQATCYVLRNPAARGFTLVEMLVSIAIFSFVMLATVSVLLNVVDANHKSQGLKTSVDNLSLILESVSRNLRTGSEYSAIPGDPDPAGCTSFGGSTGITFTDNSGSIIRYKFSNSALAVSKDDGATYTAITAPEIKIERLCFYIGGVGTADAIQPNVLITVGGVVSPLTAAGAKIKTRSRFDVQTFITQRIPEVAN